MLFAPFLAGFFPSEFPPFFAFNPFMLTDFLLHDVGHPIKGVLRHHGRDGNVVFDFEDFSHGSDMGLMCLSANYLFGAGIEQVGFGQVEMNGEGFPGIEQAFSVQPGDEVAGGCFEIDIGFGTHGLRKIDCGRKRNAICAMRILVNVFRADAEDDFLVEGDFGGALSDGAFEGDCDGRVVVATG